MFYGQLEVLSRMSVPKRVSAMGPDGTELNLDGISKPELEKIPEARAKELTGN